jgi:predicted nucleotidyltransferase
MKANEKFLMIPEFQSDGNLPKGVYQATLNEVKEIFGTSSARRRLLIVHLENIIKLAKSTGKLERVIIWGSFVSSTEFPRDLDLLLIMNDDFELDAIPLDVKRIFNYVQGLILFNADIFWTKSSVDEEAIDLWLETYQITRDFKSRGIVEVIIND